MMPLKARERLTAVDRKAGFPPIQAPEGLRSGEMNS